MSSAAAAIGAKRHYYSKYPHVNRLHKESKGYRRDFWGRYRFF